MKKLIQTMTALALATTLTACTASTPQVDVTTSTAVEEQQATSASDQTVETITIVDQADREITLEKPAQTIVSSYYITTYAAIALGLEDQLVGIENKADTRPLYTLVASELITLPAVGSLKEYNIEAVAELAPDLVLMPVRLMDQAEILTDLGITVLVVDPETQEGLEVMMDNIATATGNGQRAEELLEAQTEIYDKVAAFVEGKEPVTVYMGSNSSYLETAGSKMYQNGLITEAGGGNVFSDLEDDYWAPVSYEAILEKNPAYIIIPSAASYSVEDVMNDASLQDVSAVQNGNVFQMPTGYEELDSPVPSGALGVYWLAVTLHGQEGDDAEFEAAFDEFYREFYGLNA